MDRVRLLLVAILLAIPILGWLVVARVAHAQVFQSGSSVNIPAGKTVNDTVFAAGRTVSISGIVNGDVFCAGQDVNISGQVRGDVVCAGQNVTVNGIVTGDVRVMGQDVKLGAAIGGSVTAAAQTFVLNPEASTRSDVTIAAQDATLHGTVGRDLAFGGNTVTIAGNIKRSVHAQVQTLKLDDNARVAGNIGYTSGNTLQRGRGAQVGGTITKYAPSANPTQHGRKSFLSLAIYLYFADLILALVLVLLFPRMFEHAARLAHRGLLRTFLAGLIASIVAPVIIVILLVSVIGIPLGLLFALAWLLAVLLAGVFAAYLLGRELLRRRTNAVLAMVLGAIILFAAYLLPFIGWIIWLVAAWFGLGALLMTIRGARRPGYAVDPLPGAPAPPPEEDIAP